MTGKRIIGVVVICAIVMIVTGYIFLPNCQYANAQNSLANLTGQKNVEAFVEKEIISHALKRDTANTVLHIGQQITGTSDDPNYLFPVCGPISDFVSNLEIQKKTRRTVEKNQKYIAELKKLHEERVGVQHILTREDIQNFNSSIGKIMNLYCDRMALAILDHDRGNASDILNESYYLLKITSFPLYLTQLSKFNIALTVWLVNIYGNYVNSCELTEQEKDAFADMLQNLKVIVNDSFQFALRGECLLLNERLFHDSPYIYWRIGRYDDYFHTLNKLPKNYWKLAEQIFNTATEISKKYSNFNDYYSFKNSVKATEMELNDAVPFVQKYCQLFWVIYKGELGIYTQLKCCIVELHILKYFGAKKHLPQELAELSEVGLEKESLIDPFTGQCFSLKINEQENCFQVLHSGRNWGKAVLAQKVSPGN